MTITAMSNSDWDTVVIDLSTRGTTGSQSALQEYGHLIRHLTIIDIRLLLRGWQFDSITKLHTLDLQVESKYHNERLGGPTTAPFTEILLGLINRNTQLRTLKIALRPLSTSNKAWVAHRLREGFQSSSIREIHLVRWSYHEVQLTDLIGGCPQLEDLVLDEVSFRWPWGPTQNEVDLKHLKRLTLSRVSFQELEFLVFRALQLEELSVTSCECLPFGIAWIFQNIRTLRFEDVSLERWWLLCGGVQVVSRVGGDEINLAKAGFVNCRDDKNKLKSCLRLLAPAVGHSLKELELGEKELQSFSTNERSELLAKFSNLERLNDWRVAARRWNCLIS
ncbi:hypothetical protein BGX26_000686 [Mortierella sp. AD094]|nr:hypothetical protein BGX26_000686 [Mortierella sp. AD094]